MIARIVTGSGRTRQNHLLPTRRDERRDIGLIVKKALFPGKSYGQHKARGAAALAAAAL